MLDRAYRSCSKCRGPIGGAVSIIEESWYSHVKGAQMTRWIVCDRCREAHTSFMQPRPESLDPVLVTVSRRLG
jgi:hypothetical protein